MDGACEMKERDDLAHSWTNEQEWERRVQVRAHDARGEMWWTLLAGCQNAGNLGRTNRSGKR